MLGNIVERSSESKNLPPIPHAPTTSTSGFPTVLHRSQRPKRPSAFAAASASARQPRYTGVGKAVEARDIPSVITSEPVISEAGPSSGSLPAEDESTRVRNETGDENERKVKQMTAEERAEEVAELQGRFGSRVLEALKKRAEKRANGVSEDNGRPGKLGKLSNRRHHGESLHFSTGTCTYSSVKRPLKPAP
jgi:hypothetical protein